MSNKWRPQFRLGLGQRRQAAGIHATSTKAGRAARAPNSLGLKEAGVQYCASAAATTVSSSSATAAYLVFRAACSWSTLAEMGAMEAARADCGQATSGPGRGGRAGGRLDGQWWHCCDQVEAGSHH